jgi:hypothetical protein
MQLKLPEKHKEKDTAAAPPLNQQRTALCVINAMMSCDIRTGCLTLNLKRNICVTGEKHRNFYYG